MPKIQFVLTGVCLITGLVAPGLAYAQGEPAPAPAAPAWSPYLAGGLIGLLSVMTLAIAKQKLGASSGYADMAGLIGRVVHPRHIASLKYFSENKPRVGWSLVFVISATAGAFIAAYTGGEFTGTYLQNIWIERFGADSYALRTGFALAGGVLMAYGARLAGGCTSGHGISGTMQLALSSWLSLICFFAGGVLTAMIVYRW